MIAADHAATRCSAPPGCSSRRGPLTPAEVLDRYERIARRRARARRRGRPARPGSTTAAAVMAPLRGPRPARSVGRRGRHSRPGRRSRASVLGRPLPEDDGPSHPGAVDQPHPLDVLAGSPRGAGIRRGRRDARAASTASPAGSRSAFGRGSGLRHPRSTSRPSSALALGAGLAGLLPDPRDPIPRLSAQRGGSDPRRGSHIALLLVRPVPQSDGGARRRARLPEGLRRALSQRRLGRRAARHPGRRACALPARGRGRSGDAPHLRRSRASEARCASSSSRSRCTTSATCTSPGTRAGWRRTRARAVGHDTRPIGERDASTATERT